MHEAPSPIYRYVSGWRSFEHNDDGESPGIRENGMITDRAKRWHILMLDKGTGIYPMLMSIVTMLDKTRLILLLMFMVVLYSLQLVDPDYFWHLKTGEYIVANRALPAGDIFSYTRLGQHWVLHEWLFEVLLYGFFVLWGAVGVKVLTAGFLIFSISLLIGTTQRITRNAAAARCVTLIALVSLLGGIAPRPQLVTYAFFTIFLCSLLSFKYCQAKISSFIMPLLMIVWVNAHGGFAIGIALVGLFTSCEWLVYWISGSSDPVQRQSLARLTKVGIATLLASLASPGFLERWLYPFQVLGMAANQAISEWQSPSFHELGAQGYLILVLAFFVSYARAGRRPDVTELLVPGFFMMAGFISQRHIPLAALAITPFCARALAGGAIPSVVTSWQGSELARWYRRLAGGRELGRGEFILNWLLLLAALAALIGFAPLFREKEQLRIAAALPTGAADYVLAHGLTGRMFNNYDDGGYLIYRLAPDRKVFIDGRADLYGDQFINDFLDIYSAKANWKSKFDKLSIDYVIVSKDAPLRQLLKADSAFREVFFDEHYSVLLRNPASDSAQR